jgi:hypothetical protein
MDVLVDAGDEVILILITKIILKSEHQVQTSGKNASFLFSLSLHQFWFSLTKIVKMSLKT